MEYRVNVKTRCSAQIFAYPGAGAYLSFVVQLAGIYLSISYIHIIIIIMCLYSSNPKIICEPFNVRLQDPLNAKKASTAKNHHITIAKAKIANSSQLFYSCEWLSVCTVSNKCV